MSRKHDVVIFISNPFGFGPSANVISIMQELVNRWDGKVVYGASEMCQELLPVDLLSKIKVHTINERNSGELEILFKQYKNPLVLISLNRIAIKTAKLLGLRSFFTDCLAWLWKEIPEEYLLSDAYYCFDIFDIRDRIPKKPNIKVIPPILGNLPCPELKKNNKLLISIGGFKNPIMEKMSESYLLLLAEVLNTQNLSNEIIITGGKDALSYLMPIVKKDNVRVATFTYSKFLDLLSCTSHFITTPGLMSSLEAFSLSAPISFFLPSNLSQWHQLKFFHSYEIAASKIEWEDYLNFDYDFRKLTEREAIPIFYELADTLYKNKTKKSLFVSNAISVLESIPDSIKQKEYIDKIGINGSKFVVDDLLKILT